MFQMKGSTANNPFTSYLESRATIKVLVIPVGNISNKDFQKYFNILCRFSCIPLQTITPPTKAAPVGVDSLNRKVKVESARGGDRFGFQSLSYQYGAVYFQFINGKIMFDRNDMSILRVTEFNPHDRPLAIFGLCHCPTTEDIAEAFYTFQRRADTLVSPTSIVKGKASDAKTTTKSPLNSAKILKHCFAFDVTDLQLEKQKTFSSLEDLTVFVADRRSSDEDGSILEFQMQVDLGNMCNKIIQLLDGLVKNALSGKHLPQLRYSLDPNLAKEDAIMRNKQKKKWDMRYAGRLRKWCGDYCLVAGSPIDALQHYNTALNFMKQSGKPADHLWMGACYEGQASATIMACIEALDTYSDIVAVATGAIDTFYETRVPFQDDVERHCLNAIKHYKEYKQEHEKYLGMILKLCRYYTRVVSPKPLRMVKLINEEAFPYLKKLKTSSRIHFLVETCMLWESMGWRRKFGYYCHKISTMYADLMNWNTALYFLQLAAEAYECDKKITSQEVWGSKMDQARARTNRGRDIRLEKSIPHSSQTPCSQPHIIHDKNGWPIMRRQYLLELLQLSILTNNDDLGTKYAIESLRELQRGLSDRSEQQILRNESLSIQSPPDIIYANWNKDSVNPNPSMWFLPPGKTESQLYVMRKLHSITSGLMPKISVDMTNIPEIVNIEPCHMPSIRRHKQYVHASNTDALKGSNESEDLKGATKMAKHGTKIYYDPFAVDKGEDENKTIEWIKGETCEVQITIRNKLQVALYIQDICLASINEEHVNEERGSGDSILINESKLQSFGQSLHCPPQSTQIVKLPVKPLVECEQLNINAVSITIFNLTWTHVFNASSMRRCKVNSAPVNRVPFVKVLPPLPLMIARDIRNTSRFETGRGVALDSTSSSANKKISRFSGSSVTNLALLDGQVHNHGLLVQNVGHVPIWYVRIILVLVKRQVSKYVNMKGDPTLQDMKNSTETLKRLRPFTIFSTVDAEVSSPRKDGNSIIGSGPDSGSIFYFEPEVLENLKSQLPLKPGAKLTLPFTIDAQRDIPAAELIMNYGQSRIPAVYRSISMPFKMITSSSINISSIDTVSFDDGLLEHYGDFGALSGSQYKDSYGGNSNSNPNFFLIILVNNPTKRSFEISCYRQIDGAGINPGNSMNKEVSNSSSVPPGHGNNKFNTGNSNMPEKYPTKNVLSTLQSTTSKREINMYSTNNNSTTNMYNGSTGRPSSPILGMDIDSTTHEKVFVTPLDAGELQRIVVPLAKMTYMKKVPGNTVEGKLGEELQYSMESLLTKAFLAECTAYIRNKLLLTWKSSNGMIGSLSLHGALSTLTVNACKRMLTLPIKISTYVHLGNKTLALEDTGRPSYGKGDNANDHYNKRNPKGRFKYYDGVTHYSSPVKLSNLHDHSNNMHDGLSDLYKKKHGCACSVNVGDRVAFVFCLENIGMPHKGPDQEKVQKGLRLQLKVLKVTLNGENVYLLSDEEVALYMHFNGSLDLSIRNDRKLVNGGLGSCNIEIFFLRQGDYRFSLLCDDGFNRWVHEVDQEFKVMQNSAVDTSR